MAEGLRGLSLWAAFAASGWSIGNAFFILFSPPWWATTALGLVILSLMPAFFFTSASGSSLRRTLRDLDEGTTIEAALSPGGGPASGLIEDRARRIDESIPFKDLARQNPFHGLARFWLLALAALVILELLALVIFHRPVIAYRPPESGLGSGLAGTDSGVLRPLTGEEDVKGDNDRSQAEPKKENLPSGSGVALSQEELQAAFEALAQTREERLARLEGAAAPGTAGETQGQSPGTQKSEAAEGSGGGSGEPESGDAGAKAKGKNARGQGYEGSDTDLPPSPLIDYRSRLFQALTERGGPGVTTGESLGISELRNYQKRYFGSFALETPLATHEDAYSTLLKLRWRDLGEAFK